MKPSIKGSSRQKLSSGTPHATGSVGPESTDKCDRNVSVIDESRLSRLTQREVKRGSR